MTTGVRLTSEQVASEGLPDWRFHLGALHTRLPTKDFATGLRLVNRVGAAAEVMKHHPDLSLRYGQLDVRLQSHDVVGVTERDIALARRISQLAHEFGITPTPAEVTVLEVALDTPDYKRVKPFWRAVMGYTDHPDAPAEVRDGTGRLPTLWFQDSGADEPRQRFHLDLHVPSEVAQQRIDAAVAAGGTVVDTASSFVVLADADGNRVCICS
ncbi:MAG: 4a-hydroxytetrahydrobiopterin dehydratase [Acidimicrobiia bacterium]